jgi:HEAT repeat protein
VSCLFALLCALGPATYAAQTFDQQYQAKARDLFLAVERVARLPAPQQSQEIPPIYRDVWPVLKIELLTAMAVNTTLALNGLDEASLTPEELAAIYLRQGGWPVVAEAARARCRQLLATHAKEVEGLAREDLETKDTKRLRRGLQAAGDFRLIALYYPVAAQLDGTEEVFAAYALRELNDPRAIPLLVRHGVVRHFEVLRALQRGRPANPELLAFLDDKDPEVRWRAAYALAESGDPRLAPVVERLARDDSSQVRAEAANIGFLLPSDAFLRVRPALVTMLSDKSADVKSTVAIYFASHEDVVCAKALYELLVQEEKLEPWRQSNIVQSLQTLTGSYFGFIPGTISTPSARQASLNQFAHWISENAHKSQ